MNPPASLKKHETRGTVVVAQLTVRLLLTPDDPGSNTSYWQFYWDSINLLTRRIEKTKNKEKPRRECPIKNNVMNTNEAVSVPT